MLRSDRMKVVPGSDGWPVAYEYSARRREARLRHAAGPGAGAARQELPPAGRPLRAVAAAGGGERDRRAQLGRRLVEGAARQRGAALGRHRLQGRGRAGGARARPVRRGWSRSWRRTTRARATPGGRCCSRAGSTGSRWGSRRRDMEFHRTKEAAARDVALAFGVPPMLLGLPGDNTYANYQEAHRAFYRLTVLPLVAKTLAAISGWLPAFYGARFQIKVDVDNVPALAEEREALWRRISGAAFLSDAEKRPLLGLPKSATDDAWHRGSRRRLALPLRALRRGGGAHRGERAHPGGALAAARAAAQAHRGDARPAGEADLARRLRRGLADPRRHRLRAPVS